MIVQFAHDTTAEERQAYIKSIDSLDAVVFSWLNFDGLGLPQKHRCAVG
jgi:hypothetical protein